MRSADPRSPIDSRGANHHSTLKSFNNLTALVLVTDREDAPPPSLNRDPVKRTSSGAYCNIVAVGVFLGIIAHPDAINSEKPFVVSFYIFSTVSAALAAFAGKLNDFIATAAPTVKAFDHENFLKLSRSMLENEWGISDVECSDWSTFMANDENSLE